MIEVLAGFPDNIVACAAKGQVTKKDYDDVLIPRVKEALARQGKARCYYELGTEFSGMDAGAVWEDLKWGVGTLSHRERIAVVTDVDWIRVAINVFRFLVPGEIRIFETSRAADAKRWIAAE
jgi:SpoIIAA-like